MSEPLDSARWYVLKTFRNELRAREELAAELARRRREQQDEEFRFFVPVHYRVEARGGHRAPQLAPLLPNYVFVRATLACVFALKRQFPYLYIYPPQEAGLANLSRCVYVSDAEMQSFIIVARAYEHDQRFYQVEDSGLVRGDRVRVVGGLFDGVEGILEYDQGRSGGRVTVSIPGI